MVFEPVGLRAEFISGEFALLPFHSHQVLDGLKVFVMTHERSPVLAGESGDPEVV